MRIVHLVQLEDSRNRAGELEHRTQRVESLVLRHGVNREKDFAVPDRLEHLSIFVERGDCDVRARVTHDGKCGAADVGVQSDNATEQRLAIFAHESFSQVVLCGFDVSHAGDMEALD